MKDNEHMVGGMSRRSFAVGACGAGMLFAAGALKFVPSETVIRPPGGQDDSRLLANCLRCEKCYEACPRGVIVPQHVEDGLLSVRMPTLNFDGDYCDFCIEEHGGNPLCVSACPTGALALPDSARAEDVIIGKAVINRNWCLAYQLIGCRFCYDVCPYEAISLDGENRPVVNADSCNGCGACESVCVSLKEGSISENASSRAIVVVPEG